MGIDRSFDLQRVQVRSPAARILEQLLPVARTKAPDSKAPVSLVDYI
jgi:hypothetical protein